MIIVKYTTAKDDGYIFIKNGLDILCQNPMNADRYKDEKDFITQVKKVRPNYKITKSYQFIEVEK